MLSIIICSINPALLQQVKTNIELTIGVPFEVLFWDNRSEGKGICEVYNSLAATAQYPFLCFCHEDILFETNDWGKMILKIFKDSSKPALVGIAGSKYKSRSVSGWYTGQKETDFFYYTNIINGIKKEILHPSKWRNLEEEVVCIDGVFMACPKNVWQAIHFNQTELKGFHFYDLDFSLRASEQFSVLVTGSIQIIHLSVSGDFGEKWVHDAFVFHNYMHHKLPVTKSEFNSQKMEEKIVNVWLDRLKDEKINFKTRLKWIKEQQLHTKLKHWSFIAKFLSYKPAGFGKLFKFLKLK